MDVNIILEYRLGTSPWCFYRYLDRCSQLDRSYWTKQKEKLSYQLLYSQPLVDIDSKVRDDLNITYKGTEVDQLSILTIKIINNGDISIRPDDFEGNIELKITSAKTIISYNFSDTYPSNLNAIMNHSNGHLSRTPMLLNVGEYFTIQLFFDGLNRDFMLTARIEGISEIKALVSTPFPKYMFGATAMIMLFVLITQALLESFNAGIKLSQYLDYVFTFLITMVGLAVLQEYFFRWKNKLS